MRLPAKLSELGSFFPSEGEVGGGGQSGQYVAVGLSLHEVLASGRFHLDERLTFTLWVGRRFMDTRNATLARSRHG